MDTIEKLILEISDARNLYLERISNLTEEQSKWKPQPDSWNITEVTEHLFWAEHNGIGGMWETLHEIR
mgnify:FL=1